jgi:hypothetical protein
VDWPFCRHFSARRKSQLLCVVERLMNGHAVTSPAACMSRQ